MKSKQFLFLNLSNARLSGIILLASKQVVQEEKNWGLFTVPYKKKWVKKSGRIKHANRHVQKFKALSKKPENHSAEHSFWMYILHT